MRTLLWPLLGLMMLASTQMVNAAARLGPPIEELQKHPERIRIVAATAGEQADSAKILLKVTERLAGDSPDELLLRTDPATAGGVEMGRSYVVAWTDMRKNRRIGIKWEKDPDGPKVVTVVGLGSAAVFEDSPEVRLLFSIGPEGDAVSDEKQLEAILAQMQRTDSLTRGLVIAQLFLREDLADAMQQSQVDTVKSILQGQELNPLQRDLLLRTCMRLQADMTTPWLGEELRKVIIEHGSQYDLSSFVPALVRTAARGLGQVGDASDVDLLSILLYSNNPGVGKAALASMDQLDKSATLRQAELAFSRNWVQGDTRQALARYLGQNRP